jgi:hypothetical protein
MLDKVVGLEAIDSRANRGGDRSNSGLISAFSGSRSGSIRIPGRRRYVRAAAVMNPSDDRSGLAKAYDWAWRIMAVSLVMVLPGAAGYWIDTKLETVCLFLVAGLGLGGFAALRLLLRIVEQSNPTNRAK